LTLLLHEVDQPASCSGQFILKKEPLIINGQQVGASQSWFGLLELRSIFVPAGNWNHFPSHLVCSMNHYTMPLKWWN